MKKAQLFLLHFAGGNCYSFQFLAPFLSQFNVIPLELPGRGRRMKEALLSDFADAAKDLYAQILPKLDTSPFMIYGHSMGAYLAIHIARMLEEAGKFPLHVIVSGNAGPGVRHNRKIHLLERTEFIEELVQLGGIPQEVIDNEELFDMLEPVLRADFEIAEAANMIFEPVQAPVFAMMGSEEEHVDQIANWGRFSLGRFQYNVLDGDHFFIHRHAQRMAGVINDCYREKIAGHIER
jgi:external thioesterase TEII